MSEEVMQPAVSLRIALTPQPPLLEIHVVRARATQDVMEMRDDVVLVRTVAPNQTLAAAAAALPVEFAVAVSLGGSEKLALLEPKAVPLVLVV
mmetsp:Transcript_136360/g.265258  ORF Transcript_136360/g.265258 Transcript_136360/m.265258 type:complete len:93 (+) Transcript_136360:793-1071(+)